MVQRTSTVAEQSEAYRWFCTVCGEHSEWEYESRDQAADGREAHLTNNSCGGHWVLVQSPDDVDRDLATPRSTQETAHNESRTEITISDDTSAPSQEMRTVLDPEEIDQDHFDIPTDLGYRLAGYDRGATRALVGPGGHILTEWYTEITVVEPGTAIVKEGIHDEEVHWQPDLRELDTFERHVTDLISGYGPGGEPLPAEDYRTERAEQ